MSGRVVADNSERRSLWTIDAVLEIAAEEGIPVGDARYTFSGLLSHPDGFSRNDIVGMLRTLAAIPEDRGE